MVYLVKCQSYIIVQCTCGLCSSRASFKTLQCKLGPELCINQTLYILLCFSGVSFIKLLCNLGPELCINQSLYILLCVCQWSIVYHIAV